MPSNGLAIGGAFAVDNNANMLAISTTVDDAIAAKLAAQAAQAAALVSKNAAAASATAAQSSEDDAATDLALTNADVVLTHADVVLAEADKVQTSADRVATAADRAAIVTLYDNFDDRYLGTKSSDPSVDNDGNGLLTGAIYFNSSVNHTKFYNGSSWEDPEATATSGASTATAKASVATTKASESAASATASANSATAAANSASGAANAANSAAANKLALAGGSLTGAVTTNSTFDGRDVSTDGTKLDGIETSATADQTNAEIRAAVEAASNSNVFTDAENTKLNGIETSATADQTGAQIKTAYQAETNAFTDAQFTKLAGIAASANNYSHPSNHAISVISGLQAALDSKTTTSAVNTSISNLSTVYDPIGASVAMAIALGG